MSYYVGKKKNPEGIALGAKPRKTKPRRLNLQAQNPDQAHARLMLKTAVRSEEVAKNIDAATQLLKYRIHRDDVSALTGITLTQLDSLAKLTGATQTTGSKITRIGMVVHSVGDHMRASSFLCILESVITADENLALTGEIFLAAIDAYQVLWHHDSTSIPYTLYHCLAQRLVAKKVLMTDCPRCKTRYLELPFDERDVKYSIAGDCFNCRLVTSLMTTRPQMEQGVAVMKTASRIRRKIEDQESMSKAYRMVIHGDGDRNGGSRRAAAVRKEADGRPASWWGEEDQ